MAAIAGLGDHASTEGEFENVEPDFDLLRGTWVAPFAGYIHADPVGRAALAGYRPNGAAFVQEGGYYPSTALITLFFDGFGGIDGDIHVNRSGGAVAFSTKGSYVLRLDSVRWYNGELTLHIPAGQAQDGTFLFIKRDFKFFLRDFDHMEWVMLSATREFDPFTSIATVITSGTFTRVNDRAA